MAQYMYGKNVVRQLLKGDRKIYEILLAEGFKDKELENLALKKQVMIRTIPKRKLDQLLKTTYHQGIAASVEEYKTYTLEERLQPSLIQSSRFWSCWMGWKIPKILERS